MVPSAMLDPVSNLFHILQEGTPAKQVTNVPSDGIDVTSLQRDLARELEGEVRFDRGSIGLYSTDASNFRGFPIGVVIPRSPDDVVAALRICARQVPPSSTAAPAPASPARP